MPKEKLPHNTVVNGKLVYTESGPLYEKDEPSPLPPQRAAQPASSEIKAAPKKKNSPPP